MASEESAADDSRDEDYDDAGEANFESASSGDEYVPSRKRSKPSPWRGGRGRQKTSTSPRRVPQSKPRKSQKVTSAKATHESVDDSKLKESETAKKESSASCQQQQQTTNDVYVPVARGRGRPSTYSATSCANDCATGAETPTKAVARVVPITSGAAAASTSSTVDSSSSRAPASQSSVEERLQLVELAPNVNELTRYVDEATVGRLQTVYVKLHDSYESLHVLIGAKPTEGRMSFYCPFCPYAELSARDVGQHVHTEHAGLVFAALKSPLNSLDIRYLLCRHCNYASTDNVSMWIHYEIYHGFAGIMYGLPVAVVAPPPCRSNALERDQQAILLPFYRCLACGFLSSDNRHVAQHFLDAHPDDRAICTGSFVRMGMVSKPRTIPGNKTYAELLEKEFDDLYKEVYVCVRCAYVAYSVYLSVVHNIRTHLDFQMLFMCAVDGCAARHASVESFNQHYKAVHSGQRIAQHVRCLVTLFTNADTGSNLLRECVVYKNRRVVDDVAAAASDGSGKSRENIFKVFDGSV